MATLKSGSHEIAQAAGDGLQVAESDCLLDAAVAQARQRERASAEELLRRLIAEGLASGPSEPVTAEMWEEMRQSARIRWAATRGRS